MASRERGVRRGIAVDRSTHSVDSERIIGSGGFARRRAGGDVWETLSHSSSGYSDSVSSVATSNLLVSLLNSFYYTGSYLELKDLPAKQEELDARGNVQYLFPAGKPSATKIRDRIYSDYGITSTLVEKSNAGASECYLILNPKESAKLSKIIDGIYDRSTNKDNLVADSLDDPRNLRIFANDFGRTGFFSFMGIGTSFETREPSEDDKRAGAKFVLARKNEEYKIIVDTTVVTDRATVLSKGELKPSQAKTQAAIALQAAMTVTERQFWERHSWKFTINCDSSDRRAVISFIEEATRLGSGVQLVGSAGAKFGADKEIKKLLGNAAKKHQECVAQGGLEAKSPGWFTRDPSKLHELKPAHYARTAAVRDEVGSPGEFGEEYDFGFGFGSDHRSFPLGDHSGIGPSAAPDYLEDSRGLRRTASLPEASRAFRGGAMGRMNSEDGGSVRHHGGEPLSATGDPRAVRPSTGHRSYVPASTDYAPAGLTRRAPSSVGSGGFFAPPASGYRFPASPFTEAPLSALPPGSGGAPYAEEAVQSLVLQPGQSGRQPPSSRNPGSDRTQDTRSRLSATSLASHNGRVEQSPVLSDVPPLSGVMDASPPAASVAGPSAVYDASDVGTSVSRRPSLQSAYRDLGDLAPAPRAALMINRFDDADRPSGRGDDDDSPRSTSTSSIEEWIDSAEESRAVPISGVRPMGEEIESPLHDGGFAALPSFVSDITPSVHTDIIPLDTERSPRDDLQDGDAPAPAFVSVASSDVSGRSRASEQAATLAGLPTPRPGSSALGDAHLPARQGIISALRGLLGWSQSTTAAQPGAEDSRTSTHPDGEEASSRSSSSSRRSP